MQEQPGGAFVPIRKDGINSRSIETARSAFDSVDFITFGEQQFGKIRSILPCNACNESFLGQRDSPYDPLLLAWALQLQRHFAELEVSHV